MRDVDRIDGTDFLRIESYLHYTFHEIPYSVVREPRVDEYSYILILGIFYIDEELSMSEGCEDHKNMEKIPKKNLG